MSETTYDLIGRILHPQPRTAPPAEAPRPAALPTEPVSVLIGRIIAPPGPALRAEVIPPAAAPLPAAV